ncbi:MAG: PAS domain S-box protein [Candidatus Bathyarchaeota archaeon]|nr:PAS domain S-box protein [Candidatus Bathyarchaeota archaeon]
MRLSTQFKITLLFFSIVLIVIATSEAVASQQIERTRSQENLANSIVRGASELTYLSNDYVIYQGSQQLSDWQASYNTLSTNVGNLNVVSRQQQALVDDMEVTQQRLKDSFDSLVSLIEKSQSSVSQPQVSSQAVQGSWNGLTVSTQRLIDDAISLAQLLRAQVDRLHLLNDVLMLLTVATFCAFIVAVYLQTFRRTLKSISDLQRGTALIGSGNWDYKLREDKKDEISDLSKAFNQMASNFKATTASKEDLEREITQRKKIEEALVRSEEKYRLLVESPNSIVMTVDPALNITYMNKFGLDFFGYPPEELIGKCVIGTTIPFKDEEGRDLAEMARDIVRHPEKYKTNVHQNMQKGGKLVWVSWSNSARYDRDGKLVEVLSVGNDISNLKEAEAKLRASEIWMATSFYTRNLIEASLDPLVTIDPDGKIMDVNKATELATGCSREQLIGSDFSSYFTEPQKAAAAYKQAFTEGFVVDYPLAIRHKSGKVFDVLYNASVYVDLSGKVQGVFAAARDITERKKLEKQLQDKERLAAIGATAGMVGHDIRNPLQAIISDLFLAKSELADLTDNEQKAKVLESLDEIESNVDYINKIVADLQDYARPLNPKAQVTDIEAIIDEIIFRSDIPKNVKVNVNISHAARILMADPDFLRRIIGNLVLNAVQAMPQGGNLTIKVTKETQTDEVVLTVEDTGVGIPDEVKEKLFTPMFTTKAKGQGFGLAVIKRMTEALAGTVTFESESGRGTKFIVRLPSSNKH